MRELKDLDERETSIYRDSQCGLNPHTIKITKQHSYIGITDR